MKLTALFSKLQALRTRTPGARERFRYEESFGMPREAAYHIQTTSPWQTRILAEVEFALRMAEAETDTARQTSFAETVEATLDFLLEASARDGSLTDTVCEEAEALLTTLTTEAKSYQLILAAHAHIDMNWMWGWDETVAATVNTFRTMLRMMDEYPDFRFSQSQAATYKIIEDYAPELKDAIQKRIAEGRWEVTASAWIETDKNMPSTESLLKHIHYTKKYMHEHWGVDPKSLELDFSPDTFGHSRHLPTIDQLGGVKWYYHCRGNDGDTVLYRWQSEAGHELLVYREPYWYNSAITPLIGTGLPGISSRSQGFRTGLIVYGVGDHGGGPTRRDIEMAQEMMSWPIFPAIRFGHFRDFFQAAEAYREHFPIRKGEQNMIFPGCYTTQSEIKKGNRQGERSLRDAEIWSSLAYLYADGSYAEEIFETAWQKLLFTHFHDILTGSNTPDSKAHALGLFQEVLAAAETRTNIALEQIASRIDTEAVYKQKAELFSDDDQARFTQSEGAGPGYGLSRNGIATTTELGRGLGRVFNLFNSSATARTSFTEITVWDWTGDLRRLAVCDHEGQPLRFHLIDQELQTYWDHKYFRILVEASTPAFGYSTILIYQGELEDYPIYYQGDIRTSKPHDDFVLENEKLRAVFSARNASLIELIDKSDGRSILDAPASFYLIDTERRSSNAWNIGRYIELTAVTRTIDAQAFGDGVILQGIEFTQQIRDSSIRFRVSLHADSSRLEFESEIDFREITAEQASVPLLVYRLPLLADAFYYDVPGGFAQREPQHLDVPALSFAAAVQGERSLSLISESKYGFRADGEALSLSLLNATYHPDPYPEFAKHKTRFALSLSDASERAWTQAAEAYLQPIRYYSAAVHAGDFAPTASLLHLSLEKLKLQSLRIHNERLLMTVSAGGEAGQFSIADLAPDQIIQAVDLDLQALDDALDRDATGSVSATVAAYDSAIYAIS